MQFARVWSWFLVSHMIYAGTIIETRAAMHTKTFFLLTFGSADICICAFYLSETKKKLCSVLIVVDNDFSLVQGWLQ